MNLCFCQYDIDSNSSICLVQRGARILHAMCFGCHEGRTPFHFHQRNLSTGRISLSSYFGIHSRPLEMDQFCKRCESLLVSGPICDCGVKNLVAQTATTSRVWFNRRKELLKKDQADASPETDGPRVEKYCNRCGTLTEQTYFTAQLRSADEGQTVFYRCTKCLIQTSENS